MICMPFILPVLFYYTLHSLHLFGILEIIPPQNCFPHAIHIAHRNPPKHRQGLLPTTYHLDICQIYAKLI